MYGIRTGMVRWFTMTHSKKDFLARPLMHQLGIAVCFAILAGFMATVIVAEATLAWELFGNN